jgi:hypothetical protein
VDETEDLCYIDDNAPLAVRDQEIPALQLWHPKNSITKNYLATVKVSLRI